MKLVKKEKLIRDIILEIKRIREKKKITHEVFYNDTNIQIGRIETASKNLSLYAFYKICVYLEIKPSDLLKKIGE